MRLLTVMLLAALIHATAFVQDEVIKKKTRKKTQRTEQMSSPSTLPNNQPSAVVITDIRVGRTKGGKDVYRSKRGALYTITPSGTKRYVKAHQVIFENGSQP